MKFNLILKILGLCIVIFSGSLILPIIVSIIYNEGDLFSFIITFFITLFFGCFLYFRKRFDGEIEVSHKEAFLIVVLVWVSVSIFGSIPYMLEGVFGEPISLIYVINSLFETVSGFTTTGASVISDVESLPHGLLFWRSLTHWLGGMGIIVLSIAVLPFLGIGGMQLYKAEISGLATEKLFPRVTDTAKMLWLSYVIITLLEILFLKLAGMNLFDSICHTFGTIASGGFSTKNLGIYQFSNAKFEFIIIFFMIVAATNFFLHSQALTGNVKYFGNEEFKLLLKIIIVFFIIIYADLIVHNVYESKYLTMRFSIFQVVSIVTTTGFASADFATWPKLSQFLLLLLMFIGGSVGSTSGAIKVLRVLILLKALKYGIHKLIRPRAVLSVKVNNQIISNDIIESVHGFFLIYTCTFLVAVFIMLIIGIPYFEAIGSIAASMGGVGPAFGSLGPLSNYDSLPIIGKIVMILCMLLGRLEIYSILILCMPSYWRK